LLHRRQTAVGNVARICTPEFEKLNNQYMEEPNPGQAPGDLEQNLRRSILVDDVAYYRDRLGQ